MLKRAVVLLVKLLLFVGAVWLCVAAYWKYTDHVVSSGDLLVYFLILPVVLLLAYPLFRMGWWALRKTFHLLKARAAGRAVAPATTHAGARTASISAEGNRPADVVSTAISTYFGDEGALFLNATLQEKKRAGINEEITQELGYGVRAADVPLLEVAPAQDGTRTTMLRTRALLEKIYEQLDGVLHQAAPSADSMDDPGKEHVGVQLHPAWRGGGQKDPEPRANVPAPLHGSMPSGLSVHIVLPIFLTAPEASLIESDVVQWLHATGWPRHAVKAFTIQPENDFEYLKRLDAWLGQSSSDSSTGEWLLVLAAVSWLDTDLLNDRLRRDQRFAERLARGGAAIGELACGMLLSKTHPDSRLQLEPVARLSRLTLAQRKEPVDAKGTVGAELLTEMLADHASVLNVENRQFVGLTASGDLNDGRAVELGRWVTDSLPQLDFIDDVLCVAEHIGECGPAGSLLALTLAVAMAQQREGPVLYSANQHGSWRALAAAMPAA